MQTAQTTNAIGTAYGSQAGHFGARRYECLGTSNSDTSSLQSNAVAAVDDGYMMITGEYFTFFTLSFSVEILYKCIENIQLIFRGGLNRFWDSIWTENSFEWVNLVEYFECVRVCVGIFLCFLCCETSAAVWSGAWCLNQCPSDRKADALPATSSVRLEQ